MITEKIQLTVDAPKTELPGIDHLLSQLEKAERRITSTQNKIAELLRHSGRLDGVGTNSNTKATIRPSGTSGSTGGGKIPVTLTPGVFVVTVKGKIPVRLAAENFRAEMSARSAAVPRTVAPSAMPVDRHTMPGRIATAAKWGAASGLVYGGARFVRGGVESMVELEHQQARLRQVFRGNDVARLTDDVQRLAVANGRASKEAMESAIQWSRLGYNRVQVNEAVRVSLMAANVAEMSAAESTEKLSSLAMSYRLEASQLASVLGMLNQVSNTYNVTNKAMLDSLARSGSVARQAGLSLAELIGITGAAIGSSGQSGAVVGTATKSLIGRIASPKNQETLRGLGIETTDGSGEAKTFSNILADLFVRYQELSRAEKQSLLFGIGGTHQAARLATMMDSYVQGQVLAIEAQLNLNSAEKENALITATMRAQFQGLVSEFERFAHLQGQNGIGAGLNETARMLKNVLSLLNAIPSMSTLAAGALAAVVAKLALTGFSMSSAKKGTFASGLKERWAGLGQIAAQAIDQYPALGNFARGGSLGGQRGIAVVGPVAPANLAGVAAGSQAAAQAAATAAPQIGLLRGSLALLLSTAASLGPVMIGVAGGIMVFNRVVEAIGLSSDRTLEKVRALNQEAESASNALVAAAQAQRFLDTSRRALDSTRDPAKRAEIIEAVATVASPIDSSANEKQRRAIESKRMALRGELSAIFEVENATARTAKLDEAFRQAQGDMLARAAMLRGREAAALSSQAATLRAEITRLSNGPASGLKSTQDRVKELQSSLDDLSSRGVRQVIEEFEELNDAADLFAQHSQSFKNWTASLQGVAGAISEVYDSLPRLTKTDDIGNEILKLSTLKSLHESTLSRLKDQQAAGLGSGDLQSQAAVSSAIRRQMSISAGIGEQLIAARDRQSTSGTIRRSNSLGSAIASDAGSKEIEAEIARLEKLKKRSDAKLSELRSQIKPEALERNTALDSQIKEIETALSKTNSELAKAKAQVPFDQLIDRRAIVGTVAQAQASSYAVGDNSGEQLSNQRKQLEFAVQLHKVSGDVATAQSFALTGMLQLNAAAAMRVQMENEYLTAAMLSKELDNNRLKIAEEALNLQKEIHNETKAYQRTLLGAGPAELLRKLAVSQLGKLNSGQFFSLDPSARGDYQSQPGNGAASRGLRNLVQNNRDILNPDGTPNIAGLQAAQAAEAARRLELNAKVQPPPIPPNAVEAADALGFLRTQASTAADSISVLDRAVQGLTTRIASLAGGNGGPPSNAQSPKP